MEPFVTMRGGQDYRHYVGIITIFILMDNDPKKLVMEYLFKYVLDDAVADVQNEKLPSR